MSYDDGGQWVSATRDDRLVVGQVLDAVDAVIVDALAKLDGSKLVVLLHTWPEDRLDAVNFVLFKQGIGRLGKSATIDNGPIC